jgi:pilus assembly protein CpaD
MTTRFPIRLAAPALTALAIILVPAHAEARGRTNRSVDSVHQPVVSHSLYTFDVQAGMGGLSPAEAIRLEDWFRSIDLGYGDQIAIAGDASYVDPAAREGIADVTARHGLLIGEDSSAAAGQAPAGSVRLIVRRATARVPGCPDWSERYVERNVQLRLRRQQQLGRHGGRSRRPRTRPGQRKRPAHCHVEPGHFHLSRQEAYGRGRS